VAPVSLRSSGCGCRFEGVTPHDFRASQRTWIAERFGVMAAAKRLGHANTSVTTRHYAGICQVR